MQSEQPNRKRREPRARAKAKARPKTSKCRTRHRELAATMTSTTTHSNGHFVPPVRRKTALMRLSLELAQTYASCRPPELESEEKQEEEVWCSTQPTHLANAQKEHDEWAWEEEEDGEAQPQQGEARESTYSQVTATTATSSKSKSGETVNGKTRTRHSPCHHKKKVAGSVTTTTTTTAHKSRRILTKNAIPCGNHGRDNDEWNLIVRVRDVLGSDSHKQYVVLDLLGQGTFGQVFRCQNVATKEIVAVKVIRNHPSYHKQANIEVQLLDMLNQRYLRRHASQRLSEASEQPVEASNNNQEEERAEDDREPVDVVDDVPIVELQDVFVFHNHLCLVFEQLSLNLYELIAQNDFHGFPLAVTRGFLIQILRALVLLEESNVIHCDLKPENVLLVGSNKFFCEHSSGLRSRCQSSSSTGSSTSTSSYSSAEAFDDLHSSRNNAQRTPLIKVIDFGSACMEKETVYSYIQSRFYRSPEVLLGMDYTRAIDMWSLGCIAVEMFLGLPLFPGVSEHDQLRLISSTLGKFPPHLLHSGKNVRKYFNSCHSANGKQEYVLKSAEAYANENHIEVQVSKKYFKHSKLEDIIYACPFDEFVDSEEDKQARAVFVDFCRGLLELDPHKRWTAKEAMKHPFITGKRRIVINGEPGSCSVWRTQKPTCVGRVELRDKPLWHHIQYLFHPYQRLPCKESNCLVASNCACGSIQTYAPCVGETNSLTSNSAVHSSRRPYQSAKSNEEGAIICSCQRSATWCPSNLDWNYETIPEISSTIQGAAESVLQATANLLNSDFPLYQHQLKRTIYTMKAPDEQSPMGSPATLVPVVPTYQDESGEWQVQQSSHHSQKPYNNHHPQPWRQPPNSTQRTNSSEHTWHGSKQKLSDDHSVSSRKKAATSELDPNVRPFVPSQTRAAYQGWQVTGENLPSIPQENQNHHSHRRRNHRFQHQHQNQHPHHHSHRSYTPKRSRPRRSTQQNQRSENCAEDFASVEQRFSMAMQLDGMKAMPLPT